VRVSCLVFHGAEAPFGLLDVFNVDDVGKTSVFFHFCHTVVASNTTTLFIEKAIFINEGYDDAVANVALIVYVLNPEAGIKDFLECFVHNLLS